MSLQNIPDRLSEKVRERHGLTARQKTVAMIALSVFVCLAVAFLDFLAEFGKTGRLLLSGLCGLTVLGLVISRLRWSDDESVSQSISETEQESSLTGYRSDHYPERATA